MSSSKKLPSNIKLSINFMHDTGKIIRRLFIDILWDYCERFNTQITGEKVFVSITGIGNADETFFGVTYEGDNRYAVHLYDPSLDCTDGGELPEHRLIVWSFISSLCHEMVHVMQSLTKRVPSQTYPIKDKGDPDELYCFDPFELEARALEWFYANKFGAKLKKYIESD